MRRCTALLLAALIGATAAMPAEAQWKWRDKNKQVQYSDLPPPPDVADADILQRPASAQRRAAKIEPAASSASGAALSLKSVEPELEAKRRKSEQAEAAKKKAEDDRVAAAKADNCSRAKLQMRSLDSGIRIARTNEKGEREILDDQARAEETKRTQDVISSDCK